jgi:anti-sigma factor RsiW
MTKDDHVALMYIEWDNEMRDENARIYPEPVQSDFEQQIKREIQAWIKKQPPEKSWANPLSSAQDFWKERLN